MRSTLGLKLIDKKGVCDNFDDGSMQLAVKLPLSFPLFFKHFRLL